MRFIYGISLILYDQADYILYRIHQWARIQYRSFHLFCTRYENTENELGVGMKVHTDSRQWVHGVKEKEFPLPIHTQCKSICHCHAVCVHRLYIHPIHHHSIHVSLPLLFMHRENRDKSRAFVPRRIDGILPLQIQAEVVAHKQSVGYLSYDNQYTVKEEQQRQHGWH